MLRKLAARKRDVRREWSLDAALDQSASRLERWLAADQSSPSQRAIRQEELLRVAEAMAGLPEAQRRAIELHHLRSMPLSEIADELGTTKAAVAGLLHRGMKTLRSRLGEDLNGVTSLSVTRRTRMATIPANAREIRREPGDDREQRLNEVIAGYLEDLEAGRRPDRPGLLAQHPDLAAELASFFANREHLEQLTAPLRDHRRPGETPVGPAVPGGCPQAMIGSKRPRRALSPAASATSATTSWSR